MSNQSDLAGIIGTHQPVKPEGCSCPSIPIAGIERLVVLIDTCPIHQGVIGNQGQHEATHDDWRAAKERREDMAIRAARALVNGDMHQAMRWAEDFDTTDTELHRIGQELDGGQ